MAPFAASAPPRCLSAPPFGSPGVAFRGVAPTRTPRYGHDERLQLFRESDIVVCALPGTAETANFCGAAEFGAMKPSAIFISVGRGLAVDEDALLRSLQGGELAGAALDVFQKEPLPAESGLWSLGDDKVLITSHNADFTSDYFEAGWRVWQDNLGAYAAGATELATPVNKTAGY